MATTDRLVGYVVGLLLISANCATADEREFDIEVPYGFAGPLALKDGRLFGVDRMTMTGLISKDEGKSWKDSGPLLDGQGRPVLGAKTRRGHLPSLLRLSSGAIALKYNLPVGGDVTQLSTSLVQSTDEAATWSRPVLIARPGTRGNPTWLIQTKRGRLVLPNEYWFAQPGDRGIGICTAFSSDRVSGPWRESKDALWVWEKDGDWQGACEVPTVVETADGRLLMFMRTWRQRIAQSYSKDDGQTWSSVKLNDLLSGNSEIYLARIPGTGDLLCIWNQADAREISSGYYRARLTSAISRDSGATWIHFRTIVQSPGQPKVTRLVPAGPPEFMRTPRAVPSPEDMLSDEFHMNRAPRIHFIGDRAFVRYTHRRYNYVRGKRKRLIDQTRLRTIVSGSFYGRQ